MVGRAVDMPQERTDRTNYTWPRDEEPMEEESPHADSELVEGETIATFRAMYQRMSTSKAGDLVVVFLIPKVDKLQAVKVSDFPSKIFTVKVTGHTRKYSKDVEELLGELAADVLPGSNV